ncbi:MAG TPA: hypothetical protein VNJ08_06030 [Bacteriovoracaceae bacterium]|nr:hypothetical protein [Bacteriovoracaceae bacterium]
MKYLYIILCLLITHPGLCQDDEAMLRELERAKKAQAESFNQIDQGVEAVKKAPLTILEELKKAGHKSLDLAAMMDPRMMPAMKRTIKESGMQNMGHAQAKSMIMLKVKDKPMEKVFSMFPKLHNMAAGILIDPDAISSLLDIIPRKEDLKFFGWCSLGLFAFGILLRHLLISKKAGFLQRLFFSLSVHAFITLVIFGLFFIMFEKEVSPSLKVVARYL